MEKIKCNIVYSILAHEKPECVWNMYENIMKFHRGLYVEVIVHANPPLYEELRRNMPPSSTLLLHPEPTYKERFTSSLFFGHLSNYEYMKNVDFEFFCPLASNCMFVHPPKMDEIRKNTAHLNPKPTGYAMPDPDRWMFQEFVKNPKLEEIFRKADMEICIHTHEGAYFRKETMDAMVKFFNVWGLNKSVFENDVLPAEEVVLPSIEKALTGVVGKRYCGWIPNIKESDVLSVIETGTCPSLAGHYANILKIPRDMKNPLRKMLTERRLNV